MLGVAPQNAAADPAPAPGSPSEAATPAAQRPAPSALKGTMIGVAPPSVAALRNAAAQPASGDPQSTSPLGSQLKSTMLGSAPPEGAGASPQAPAGVNPLGGTMVGTSPFHSPTASTGKPALTPAPPRDVENEDISQDSGVFEPVASAASALMSSHPSSHDLDAEPAPAFDATDATPAEPYRAPQRSASPASPPQFSAPAVRKSNAPVILLIGVILVICLLLAAFVL